MKRLKNNRGITLLALIVTIIVLLILAGITIGMITGDNGIITKTEEAKFKANVRALEEDIDTYKVGEQQKNKIGIDMYPVIQSETLETVDKNLINENLKKRMVKWASTAGDGEIATVDTIDYSKFYKLDKEKVTSAESFAGDLYLILVGNDYKVISIVGEKYLSSKTYILIPPNDQAEPEYITIANNTYKLYGDGTVKVVGEMTTNSGMTDEEKDSLLGVQTLDLKAIAEGTDMAFDENVQTDDETAKLYGVKRIHISQNAIYVIDANDDLWGWGDNSYNKMGQGHSYLIAKPTKLLEGRTEGETGVKAKNVWGGSMNTYVLDTNGQLWGAGTNTAGTLSQNNTNIYNNFVKINIDGVNTNDIKYIQVGKSMQNSYAICLLNNGDVYGVGFGGNGQLGLNRQTNTTLYEFTNLANFDTKWKNIKDVYAQGVITVALTNDGVLYGTGYNVEGVLGVGDKNMRYALTQIMDNIEEFGLVGNSVIISKDNNGAFYMYSSLTMKKVTTFQDKNAHLMPNGEVFKDNKLYVRNTNTTFRLYTGDAFVEDIIPNVVASVAYVSDGKLYINARYDITKPGQKNIYQLREVFKNAVYVQGKGQNLSIVDGDGNIYETVGGKNSELSNIKKLVASTTARYALSNDGKLYAKGGTLTGMWGSQTQKNSYIQVTKDGTTPFDNVKDIFATNTLATGHAASAIFITEDNKIYWAGSDGVTGLPGVKGDEYAPGMGEITNYPKEASSEMLDKIKDKIVDIDYQYINSGGIQGNNALILTQDGKVYTYSDGKAATVTCGLNKTLTDFEEITFEPGTTVKEVATQNGLSLVLLSNGNVYGWGYNTYGILGDGYEIGEIYSTPVKLDLKNIRTMSLGDNFAIFADYNGAVYGIGRNDYGQLGTGDNIGAEVFIRCEELEK